MSDEELDTGMGSNTDHSFEEVEKEDENVASKEDLRSRIKTLEEDNLALRQELSKKPPSRAEHQITKSMKLAKAEDDQHAMTTNSMNSRIFQAQDEAFRKLDKLESTSSEYMPAMNYRSSQYQRETLGRESDLITVVQELLTFKENMESRLANLETISDHYGRLQNRVAVCEKKLDSLIGQKKSSETKIQEAISHIAEQNRSKERNFQAFISPRAPLNKKTGDIRIDQCLKIFIPSPHFSQTKCEYTVPKSGLYEFCVRWRQSGKGQLQVSIHWGEEKLSRLGETSPDNKTLCPVIRRYVEAGVNIWLTIMVTSGTPILETCDFGGSFVCSKHVVETNPV